MSSGLRNTPRALTCGFCEQVWESYATGNNVKYCSDRCRENGLRRKRAYNVPGRCKELATGARNRSRHKSVPYDIDGDYVLGLWEKQKGLCAITSQPFNLSYSDELQKGWSKKDAPSLDRIKPELGYTRGNVRLVLFQVNCAMGVYTDEDFYTMCEKSLLNRR